MKLYSHPISGNAYKVKLFLSLLGQAHEEVIVDLLKGEHRQPDFLALNPFGKIPVLVDGDVVIADSQAILVYLARQAGKDAETWLPLEALPLSEVVRWLSVAAEDISQGPGLARLCHLFNLSTIDIDRATQRAGFTLDQLNRHLSEHDWLACGRPTIADVAVFPYVVIAPDGKISLDPYPQVLAWIDRIKQLPGFVAMAGIE